MRAGQTEAAVDLARIAGLYPAGVICEIMNEDGTMARVPELTKFAQAARAADDHDRGPDPLPDADRGARPARRTAALPTDHGDVPGHRVREHARQGNARRAGQGGDRRRRERDGPRALPLPDRRRLPLRALRLRRAARRGDDSASRRKGAASSLYLNQEGRGIGLANKIRAYELQEQGLDTVEANERLGFKADQRDYGIGVQILKDLGVRSMRLLSNNPRKLVGLEGYGLSVAEWLPLEIPASATTMRYLKTKKDKLGHRLKGV